MEALGDARYELARDLFGDTAGDGVLRGGGGGGRRVFWGEADRKGW